MADEKKIQRLIEKLDSVFPEVRWRTVGTLGEIAKNHQEYNWKNFVPVLIDSFKDENLTVQRMTAGTLCTIGAPAVPALIQTLKDDSQHMRGWAVYVLAEIGGARVVPYVINALNDDDSDVREEAARALGKIAVRGGDVGSAVSVLIDAFKDKDSDVKGSAAWALGEISSAGAVPVLIQALKDKNSRVRYEAADALEKMGLDKIPVEIKTLALLILDKLRKVTELGESAVPVLVSSLKDKHGPLREKAAWALGEIGDMRQVPALTDVLNDEIWNVRLVTADALRKIAEKTADEGDYSSALKMVKDSTQIVMKFYEGKKNHDSLKERKKNLKPFVDFTEKIHRRMNQKNKFTVKHQPVGTVRKKVIVNG